MSNTVTITRCGNLLEINPACEDVLSGILTYNHRVMLFGKDARTNKKGMSIRATRVYTEKDGKLYVQHGVLERVRAALEATGRVVEYVDARGLPKLVPDYENLKRKFPDLVFRTGQDQALAFMIGSEHGQLEAPTGWGKTTIMSVLAALYPTARILICTPGKQLLGNTVSRLISAFGPEVGECSSKKQRKGRIMVSTYGSLQRAVILMGGEPDIVFVDECHKAAADGFASSLSSLRLYRKIFGLTATPQGRSDNAELVVETLLGPVIFRVGYDEMVNAGAVCPMRVARVNTAGLVEAPAVQGMSMRTAKLRHAYWRNRARNELIARCIAEVPKRYALGDDPQVLVLVDTIEHANYLHEYLPDYEVIHGKRDAMIGAMFDIQENEPLKCDELRARFESGTLRKAIATGMWGTGVDFVQLDVLVYASGAPSHITTTQWAGRNSRMRAGKKFGLVIDFSDRWDEWTASRSIRRMGTFKTHGWKIDNITLRTVQEALPGIV